MQQNDGPASSKKWGSSEAGAKDRPFGQASGGAKRKSGNGNIGRNKSKGHRRSITPSSDTGIPASQQRPSAMEQFSKQQIQLADTRIRDLSYATGRSVTPVAANAKPAWASESPTPASSPARKHAGVTGMRPAETGPLQEQVRRLSQTLEQSRRLSSELRQTKAVRPGSDQITYAVPSPVVRPPP